MDLDHSVMLFKITGISFSAKKICLFLSFYNSMQWCTVSISVYLHVLNICNISQRLTWGSEQHVPVMFFCAFNIILLANVQQE